MLSRLFGPRRKRRGLGLLAPDEQAPQEQGKRDWDIGMLGLAGATVVEADLTSLVVSVLNQGASSSCVANAWEQAIRMERKRLGYPVELGSRLFGYSNSRAEHDMAKHDVGTYLRTYAWALKKVGNCPEGEWPFILSRINRTPPARCYRKAWAMRGIRGYYKIFDNGAARTAATRSALAEGKPVVFGTQIDAAFQDDDGPTLIDVPKGASIGGHAMCVVGFRQVSGEWQYKIVNSWGTGWRSNGFAWFTEEFLQWYALQDLWVVSLV